MAAERAKAREGKCIDTVSNDLDLEHSHQPKLTSGSTVLENVLAVKSSTSEAASAALTSAAPVANVARTAAEERANFISQRKRLVVAKAKESKENINFRFCEAGLELSLFGLLSNVGLDLTRREGLGSLVGSLP